MLVDKPSKVFTLHLIEANIDACSLHTWPSTSKNRVHKVVKFLTIISKHDVALFCSFVRLWCDNR